MQAQSETQTSEQNLYLEIRNLLYTGNIDRVTSQSRSQLLERVAVLGRNAFQDGNEESLLAAHRVLYVIYLARLEMPWTVEALNVDHPLIYQVRHTLEQCWDQSERKKHAAVLSNLPPVPQFREWTIQYVQSHSSNVNHPLFPFLRDKATFEQMREFILQETPLEVLFGDIIALMLPGVYGKIKLELAKNFWDEVGHAQDPRVHRNMRFRLMEFLQIPADVYTKNIELLVREELALINMYLGLATNRASLTQLLGVLLTTETMIPGRFELQIEGWRRHGVSDETIAYLLEHTTVDVEHAKEWMDGMVVPLLNRSPHLMGEIVLGMLRRLDIAGAVCDKLFTHIKNLQVTSIGPYRGPIPTKN
jgi:pyrroloquinoline quinone (PQQ) biosynthesis protein C